MAGAFAVLAKGKVVKFTATSLGGSTSGSFELYLDGSDAGLTVAGEDVDAVKLMDDGRMLSTRSSFTVAGVSGNDEDIPCRSRCDRWPSSQ